jgi:tetratricopeptide (TPR) repeat protein
LRYDLNSHLQKLVETLFECDREGVAGTLTVGTQLGSVSFQLEDGFLVNSQIKGPGQMLSDFLVATGWISREEHTTARQMAKAEGVAPWVAMMRMGLITEEGITQARFQLAAQRFSLLLGTGFGSVAFEPGGPTVAARKAGAQRAIPLVLEYLRIALEGGRIEPYKVPPYVMVRPSDRLKLYLDNLRAIIPGELPLPALGGETYESLRTRYGAAADVLSILFWTGMLVTEEEAVPPAGEAHITVPRLFQFVRNLIRLSCRDLMDDSSVSADIACETGNLLLEGFGAFESALYFFRMMPESSSDEDLAADRRVLLSFLAGRAADVKVDTLPSRISSIHAGRETKAALLRYLSIYFFFRGKIRESARCLHEAFIYRPYDFDNLSLFVQLFTRDPAIALGQEGHRGLEIESFNESEYPDVLPLAVSCARDNDLNELISWIMHEGIGKVQVSSQIFDQIIDIMRDLKWGPDLVEFITHFSLSSDRKGWTNPLWTLGSLYSAENIDDTLGFAREAYEILIKTSSGKQWAFTKLVDIMGKIGQPNMMLVLLERAFREAPDPQQRVAVGQRLATLLLEEFGELKEAAAVGAKVVEIDPQDAPSVGVILKALSENKLGISGARRFVSAMLRSSVSAGGEHARWFEGAARAAEEILGAPDLAAALMERMIEENPEGKDPGDAVERKKRLDEMTESAARETAELREKGLDVAGLIREKAAQDPAEARRLMGVILKDPGERDRALPCVEALFEAGARPWRCAPQTCFHSESTTTRMPPGSSRSFRVS